MCAPSRGCGTASWLGAAASGRCGGSRARKKKRRSKRRSEWRSERRSDSEWAAGVMEVMVMMVLAVLRSVANMMVTVVAMAVPALEVAAVASLGKREAEGEREDRVLGVAGETSLNRRLRQRRLRPLA